MLAKPSATRPKLEKGVESQKLEKEKRRSQCPNMAAQIPVWREFEIVDRRIQNPHSVS